MNTYNMLNHNFLSCAKDEILVKDLTVCVVVNEKNLSCLYFDLDRTMLTTVPSYFTLTMLILVFE